MGYERMTYCNECGSRLMLPEGPSNADILLVADSPTQFDIKEGALWTGPGGEILRVELRRAGINYNACRITNIWQHVKSKDCSIEVHIDTVLTEMANRRAILLMGADAVNYFTGENVSDVSGLRVDTLDYAKEMLPKGPIVYALFNPAVAIHDKLGEIRFGLGRFGDALKEI